MNNLHTVLSQEKLVEQVKSNKSYYNNTQNVENNIINPILSNTDDDLLAQIGYKPELKRSFTTFQCFAIAFSIMGLLPSIASIYSTGIIAGPAGLLWGWVISSIFILTIGIAMSESGSSISTSGGLYYWTNYYAPPRIKTVLSYLIGNTNSIALIAGFVSVNYGFGNEILCAVSIAKDGDFEITQAKVYGVFVACTAVHLAITSMTNSKNCGHLQTTSCVFNTFIIVVYLIAMLVGGKGNYKPASFVFGQFKNFSDWPIGFTQVSQAFQPAVWTIGAFDSVIHQSEEVANPSRTIPIGIIGSISTCGILGFIIILVTNFCTRTNDIEGDLLESKYGLAFGQLIMDNLGKRWALFFVIFMAICQFLMGASILVAISRQIWSFGRDNGLPVSFWIKKVNKKLSVPVNAVIFGALCAIIIGLLVLIGAVAANAVFTLYIACNYICWGCPTFLRLTYGRKKFRPGKFYLGKILSPLNGWISILFGAYIVIVCQFPAMKKVDKDTMNYTCVVSGAVWILSFTYYMVYARKNYHGPCKTIDIDDDSEMVIEGVEEPSYIDNKLSNEKV